MRQKIFRILLFLIGGSLSLLLLYHLYLNFQPELKLLIHFDAHNEQLLIKMVRSHGIEELGFLFVLNAICVAIPGLSNGIFSVLTGIICGPARGFLINWLSDIIGQIILLFLLQKLYNPEKLKNSRIYHLVSNQRLPQISLAIGYMIPFIPSATIAYANALINKSFSQRLIPIITGTLPMAYLYAYGGDSILHLNMQRIISTIVAFVIIAIIAIAALLLIQKIAKQAKKL